MLRAAIAAGAAILALAPAAYAQQADREKLIASTKLLEQEPFHADAPDLRRWALVWLQKTPDVEVTLCEAASPFLDEKLQATGGPELMLQSMMANGSFKLQNPGAEENAAQLAGLESALKAYEAMLRQKPEFKTASIDDLLVKRDKGELGAVAVCKDKN